MAKWIEYEIWDASAYIPMQDWGKDHWSTLAYLETRAVESGGIIENKRMRCNSRLHREFVHVDQIGDTRFVPPFSDGSKYPTIARNGQIQNHDDWSCLEDIAAAGLIKASYRVVERNEMFGNSQAKVEFTDLGYKIAGMLREHKARGGNFKDFQPLTA